MTSVKWIALSILLFASAFVMGRFLTVRNAARPVISARELRTAIKQKSVTLLNVHDPYQGEIPYEKTLLIPSARLTQYSMYLPKDKRGSIIVYDKSGSESETARTALGKLGYSNVRVLQGGMDAWQKGGGRIISLAGIPDEVNPADGIALQIPWGTRFKELVDAGVIDLDKFRRVTQLTPEETAILTTGSPASIRIDRDNAQFVVDVLWALGLAQKSLVYDTGPLGTQYKNKAGNFASTGGWNLGRENALQYLNRYDLIPLSASDQERVAALAKNIYRPCCDNPTWFPDCNHGMAALAVIELMVANHADDAAIYRKVLGFNSFWFSDSYVTVATHFARRGMPWKSLDPKVLLGPDYSSATGASKIGKSVGPIPFANPIGGSC